MSVQPVNASKGPQTFEFTKRKRWADLLAAELADVIILILSPTREILYCGNAVTELLGWRVLDLLDHDLLDLIPSPDDQLSFCSAFQHSIATNLELLSYLRFKSNSPSGDELSGFKELLFELKGYPHFVNDECRCFFAMAKPYPSRNTSMLNTFLELKMEHERLRHRLTELQSQLPPRTSASSPSIPTTSAIYATSTIPSQGLLPVTGPQYSKSLDHPNTRYALSSANYEDILSGSRDVLESANYGRCSLYSSSVHADEDSEEGVKKKKLKKSHSVEQYVCITCGRTDSPEWRKGPLGPKTLCNACGLRWAKQMRKYDEPAEGSSGNDAPS
ncbi:white collar 2 type of transcription factor [Amanita rubescens]|nr:white collar 2 type of transcription factor [Amanita rubescens]